MIGTVVGVCLLTLVRFALVNVIELLPEEAYYWMYAKHPALGYFDHPPMVAWIIAAGTAIFGDTELGVRVGTFLLWIASCGLVFSTGRLWFGQRAALAATLLFTLVPVYIGMGLIVTPDAPVLFFWLATLYFISRAVHTHQANYWLLAGIAFGGALLSKYYALLLAPSVALFLAVSPTHRRWLKRPQFWLALPVALLMFSPVIVWNAHHDWASFLFQSTRTTLPQKHMLRDVLRFWFVQVAMLGPVFFTVFVGTAARAIKCGWLQREDRWNFVVSFSLPLFLLFTLASFKMEIHVNWTAPAFLSLALGAGAIAVEGLDGADMRRITRWRIGWGTAIALSIAVVVVGHSSLAWGFPKPFSYARAGGWRALAREVENAREELAHGTGEQPFVLGMDKYNFAAELGFYLHQPDNCINTYALAARGLGFRYWADLRKFEGRPAVVVANRPSQDSLAELHRRFDRVGDPTRIGVQRHGTQTRTAYLIKCHGYHGEAASPGNAVP